MIVAKREKDLIDSLRERGVRKKVAREMARAARGEGEPRVARRNIAELASVVEEIHDRLRDGPAKRSAAARKAARTRLSKADKRRKAAKRGARTRALSH